MRREWEGGWYISYSDAHLYHTLKACNIMANGGHIRGINRVLMG